MKVTFNEIKKATINLCEGLNLSNEEIEVLARKRFEGKKNVAKEMIKARDEGRLSPEMLKNPKLFDVEFIDG